MTGGHLTSISLSLRLSLSLLFQHFVFVLGIIEDILFVVDSVVLLGFDMATIGFGLLNVLHQYICICIFFYNFRCNAATSAFACMHLCNYWEQGGANNQGGREVSVSAMWVCCECPRFC